MQPPIEILIGAGAAGKLYIGNLVQLRCDLVAGQTWLGWVVMGMLSIFVQLILVAEGGYMFSISANQLN
jgi:RecA-family ATPase